MYEHSFSFEAFDVDLYAVLMAVKEGRWKHRIQLLRVLNSVNKSFYDKKKVRLPAVTFCGTFNERGAENLKEYSKFVCLDVDGINPDTLKQQLLNEPYIYSMFASPSNQGLKILIRVNNEAENHREAILHLTEYFKLNHGITIDRSCKDVSRLCFVSYDPELYFNHQSHIFEVDIFRFYVEPRKPQDIQVDGRNQDITYTFDFCFRMTNNTFPYEVGNRNNHIFQLSAMLNERGIDIVDTVNMINSKYPTLPEDCEQTIYYVYKKKQNKFNTIKFDNAPKIAHLE